MNYRNLNMVFNYITYLKSWECILTTDKEHRIKYYGYGDSIITSMREATAEYRNAVEGISDAL